MRIELQYLNHAAMVVEMDGVRLLSDPWFEGSCFSEGWGLSYENPDAYEVAATATDMWISHWHSDHLHVPTLRKLVALNPNIRVWANVSANFSMAERMRGIGFRNVFSLDERRWCTIGGGVRIQRFPTASIDNMLVMEGPSGRVLNYNDCNLPLRALGALRSKIGPIDLMLTNYNHAGKLFEDEPPDTVREGLGRVFRCTVDALAPRFVVPFASSHFYRCAASQDQNASLLDFDDTPKWLRSEKSEIVHMRIGDRARFSEGVAEHEARTPAIQAAERDTWVPPRTLSEERVLEVANGQLERMRKGFPAIHRLIPTIHAEVEDLGRVLELDLKRGARFVNQPAHIRAHSTAVETWLGRPFGSDTFLAGAHFAVTGHDLETLKRFVLIEILASNHLSFRDIVELLASTSGSRFWWNRREELYGTFAGFRFRAGEARV